MGPGKKSTPGRTLESGKGQGGGGGGEVAGGHAQRVLKGTNQSEGQRNRKNLSLSLSLSLLSQLSPSHPHPATRNAADWWLSHWISQLKEAKNSSQEAPAPITPDSTGLLSAQLLLFSPGSL